MDAERDKQLPNFAPDWALFLDIDGTLLDLAPTPGSVVVEPSLRDCLSGLSTALRGALALVSGRSINDIDRLFAPLKLPVAGLHGAERRTMDGSIRRHAADKNIMTTARERLARLQETWNGLLLEDKGGAIAVHYRARPDLKTMVEEACAAIAEELGSGLQLQLGKSVMEFVAAGVSKGAAIEEFSAEAPFAGRRAVMLGDDVTDESGFASVHALGGISIKVGEGSSIACRRVASPALVRDWLARYLEYLRDETL
jgi:trehalose 6-phosphate phosphatase